MCDFFSPSKFDRMQLQEELKVEESSVERRSSTREGRSVGVNGQTHFRDERNEGRVQKN